MRTFGIFTAYSPNTKFPHEGLGRYLASFVKAGMDREDVKFVVACPSWSREALTELFTESGIPEGSYDFLGPSKKPIILALRDLLPRSKKRKEKKSRRLPDAMYGVGRSLLRHFYRVVGRLLGSRNIFEVGALGLYLLTCAVIALPFVTVVVAVSVPAAAIALACSYLWKRIKPRFMLPVILARRSLSVLDRRLFASLIYRSMLMRETDAVIRLANKRRDISAWYCPTALWPEVHNLRAPRLICLPDVVFAEFPVAFAKGGEHLHLSYQTIVRTMQQPSHFVTYSNHIKWAVAVERFGVAPGSVSVIEHAANDLTPHLNVTGFPDIPGTTENYKQQIIAQKINNNPGLYTQAGIKIDFDFIFYASQFRPSKNVITLLRAYEYLLKTRHFGRKLLLTGDPTLSPEVAGFVSRHNLRNDVVFVPGLSDAQLAAAYSLADLAVNPSLSEGGMPFTFTEALSMGTPVVMGDIAVAREVLTDTAVAEATLFDPYDWRALADKIELALENRAALYEQQRAFYDANLAARTWGDVVSEHIRLLDKIATTPQAAA